MRRVGPIVAGWAAGAGAFGSRRCSGGGGGDAKSSAAQAQSTEADDSDSHGSISASMTDRMINDAVREDPAAFKIGYNMGKLSVQLETMKSKLDDNRELLKSQLSGLRETARVNHDGLRRMQLEVAKQSASELHDGVEKLGHRFDTINSRMTTGEESMKELTRQQFQALQKHIDDRLENIKDLVKLTALVLLAILVWILLTVANIYNHVHHTQQHAAWLQVQSNSALLSKLSADGHGHSASPPSSLPQQHHHHHPTIASQHPTHVAGEQASGVPSKKSWLW